MANYTILLIDYNPRSIEAIKTPLERAGYHVAVANDGVAGIQAFHELSPDLTLIEAMLPKKHGFDVCRELKSTVHGETNPVVILTDVYRGRKYRSEATHRHRCDLYLEKPLTDAALLDAIGSFLPISTPAPEIEVETLPDVTEEEAASSAPPVQVGPTLAEIADAESAEREIIDQLDTLFSDEPKPATPPRPQNVDPNVEA